MTREEFEKDYYVTLRNAALKQMLEAFAEEREGFFADLSYKLESTLEKVRKLQEMVFAPIKCIQLSLMRYSVLKGTPVMRIDVYGEGGILSNALVTEELKVSWAAVGLEELREKLLLKVEDSDELYPADVEVRMSETVDWIVHCFRENLRYEWKLAEELEALKHIEKAKDFYISVGEYMDKQEYMYVERGPIDIFFNVEKETLIYRKYKDAVYTNKRFTKLELEGARFINCVFHDSAFTSCNLMDCTFENCNLKKTVFEDCDIRGSVFMGCTLQKVDHIKTDGNAYSGRRGVVCRHLKYDNCELKQVSYKECDISYAKIRESKMKAVLVDTKSIIQNSDFSEFVTNEEGENASV